MASDGLLYGYGPGGTFFQDWSSAVSNVTARPNPYAQANTAGSGGFNLTPQSSATAAIGAAGSPAAGPSQDSFCGTPGLMDGLTPPVNLNLPPASGASSGSYSDGYNEAMAKMSQMYQKWSADMRQWIAQHYTPSTPSSTSSSTDNSDSQTQDKGDAQPHTSPPAGQAIQKAPNISKDNIQKQADSNDSTRVQVTLQKAGQYTLNESGFKSAAVTLTHASDKEKNVLRIGTKQRNVHVMGANKSDEIVLSGDPKQWQVKTSTSGNQLIYTNMETNQKIKVDLLKSDSVPPKVLIATDGTDATDASKGVPLKISRSKELLKQLCQSDTPVKLSLKDINQLSVADLKELAKNNPADFKKLLSNISLQDDMTNGGKDKLATKLALAVNRNVAALVLGKDNPALQHTTLSDDKPLTENDLDAIQHVFDKTVPEYGDVGSGRDKLSDSLQALQDNKKTIVEDGMTGELTSDGQMVLDRDELAQYAQDELAIEDGDSSSATSYGKLDANRINNLIKQGLNQSDNQKVYLTDADITPPVIEPGDPTPDYQKIDALLLNSNHKARSKDELQQLWSHLDTSRLSQRSKDILAVEMMKRINSQEGITLRKNLGVDWNGGKKADRYQSDGYIGRQDIQDTQSLLEALAGDGTGSELADRLSILTDKSNYNKFNVRSGRNPDNFIYDERNRSLEKFVE